MGLSQKEHTTSSIVKGTVLWLGFIGSMILSTVGAYVITSVFWLLYPSLGEGQPMSVEELGTLFILMLTAGVVYIASYGSLHNYTLRLLAANSTVRVWQRYVPRLIALVLFVWMAILTYIPAMLTI